MKLLLKLLVSSLAVFFAAYILPGVQLDGYPAALIVALILGALNAFLKPMLVLLTIPVTMVTFGFFLLVINAFMIMITDSLLDRFAVKGFWSALLFSIVVSVFTAILEALAKPRRSDSDPTH